MPGLETDQYLPGGVDLLVSPVSSFCFDFNFLHLEHGRHGRLKALLVCALFAQSWWYICALHISQLTTMPYPLHTWGSNRCAYLMLHTPIRWWLSYTPSTMKPWCSSACSHTDHRSGGQYYLPYLITDHEKQLKCNQRVTLLFLPSKFQIGLTQDFLI